MDSDLLVICACDVISAVLVLVLEDCMFLMVMM